MIALPSISSYFQISLNSATREMATTVKEAYNSTVVTGKIHRIVYDLKKNEYWVEVGPTTILLDTKASKQKEEERRALRDPARQAQAEPLQPRQVDHLEEAEPARRGVEFEDILSQQSPTPSRTA